MDSFIIQNNISPGEAEFLLRLWSKRFEQEEKRINSPLSCTELLILYAVARGYVFQSRIAQLLDLAAPTVSQSIAKLLSADLLCQSDGADRRFRTLELTAKGKLFLDERENFLASNREKFFPGVTPEELCSMLKVLSRLAGVTKGADTALKKS